MAAPVIQLFVNTAAGSASQRRTRALQAALERAGAGVIVTPSSAIALSVDPAATHVCAVGGDGTLRHVADAIARSGRTVPMGVYPLGTVNLLARECNYVRHPARFTARLLAGAVPRHLHIARIGDEGRLFTCASVGPDSRAVAAVSTRAKRLIGRAAYALAFATVLLRWQRPRLQLVADGRTVACEAVYIAKGLYYAGPWSFAPAARADDALLHVVALRHARRRDFLHFCLSLLRHADPARGANVIRFTCTELSIIGAAGTPLQADGDIVAALPVDIRIDPVPLAFI